MVAMPPMSWNTTTFFSCLVLKSRGKMSNIFGSFIWSLDYLCLLQRSSTHSANIKLLLSQRCSLLDTSSQKPSWNLLTLKATHYSMIYGHLKLSFDPFFVTRTSSLSRTKILAWWNLWTVGVQCRFVVVVAFGATLNNQEKTSSCISMPERAWWWWWWWWC